MCIRDRFATDHLAQSRISKSVIAIHSMICSLSRLDLDIRNGVSGDDLDRDRRIVEHLFGMLEHEIEQHRRELRSNTDATMREAASAALRWAESLPDGDYAIPESTPVESARGRGKDVDQSAIRQFGAGTVFTGESC